jgi:hypothetical protein
LGWQEQFITTRRNLVAMKKQGVQRSTPRTDLRETAIREGERLVSKESKEVNLFARLVAIPVPRLDNFELTEDDMP